MNVPITIHEAKTHLRVSHSGDDSYIMALTLAAIQAVEQYQNRTYYTDATGVEVETMPALEKQACLLMIAHMYDNRTAVTDGTSAEIPLGFRWLLSLRRKVPA